MDCNFNFICQLSIHYSKIFQAGHWTGVLPNFFFSLFSKTCYKVHVSWTDITVGVAFSFGVKKALDI